VIFSLVTKVIPDEPMGRLLSGSLTFAREATGAAIPLDRGEVFVYLGHFFFPQVA